MPDSGALPGLSYLVRAVGERVATVLCAVGFYWLNRWLWGDPGAAAVGAVVLWCGPWWGSATAGSFGGRRRRRAKCGPSSTRSDPWRAGGE